MVEHSLKRSPSLPRLVLFLIALLVLPSAIGTWWLQAAGQNKLLIQAFFFPVELLGVLLPAWIFSWGFERRRVLRWRSAPASWVVVAGFTSLGWGGLLTFAQTAWQHATGLAPPPGLEWLLGVHTWAEGILLVSGAALLPALCEETAFRGLVLSGLGRWGQLGGVAATTVLFAAYHMEPYGIPTYLVLGAFLGWLAWRSDSLLPGIAAHAMNNVLALLQIDALPEAWWWTHVAVLAPLSAIIAFSGTFWLHRRLHVPD